MSFEHRLSRRERQIMDVLHKSQKATVAEVLDALPDPPGYSAVRALLRILEEKGHVRHVQEGPRYLYLPIVSGATARRSALKRVVATFFQGSVPAAMAALLETGDTGLSEAEVNKLRQMIEKARNEGK
jgi:predicted transcriptional regulator